MKNINPLTIQDILKNPFLPYWLFFGNGERYLVKVTSINLEPYGLSYRCIYKDVSGYCSLTSMKVYNKNNKPR